MKKHLWTTLLMVTLIIIIVVATLRSSTSTPTSTTLRPLEVAAILPLSGPAAYPGEEAYDGMLLALDEINHEETRINLTAHDSKTKPAEGVAIVNQLESTLAPDLYISGTSSVSMAVAPLAAQYDFPLAAIFAYAPDLTKQNGNTFRLFPLPTDEVPHIMKTIDELGVRNVGILHLNDDYGNSVKNALVSSLAEKDIETHTESFLAPDQDVRTQLHKLKNAGVDALYVVGFDSHVINGILQAREIQYEGALIASVALPQPASLERLGSLLDTNTIWSSYPQISQEFSDAFREKHGYESGVYGANGYIAMHLIADQLLDAPTHEDPTQYIVDTLNGLPATYDSALGTLEPNGQEIPFELFRVGVEGGEVVYYED